MKKSQWKIDTSLESKRADYTQICSICLSSDSPEYSNCSNQKGSMTVTNNGSSNSSSSNNNNKCSSSRKNPLITPCLCSGMRSHQHKRCIEQWIEETGTTSCPFCFVRYEYTRKRKSFWSYVRDSELEKEFLVTLGALVFSLYLFLVGISVCYHYATISPTSWASMISFCFACTASVLLFIGIISTSLSIIFHHYAKYWLWSKTHFSVDVSPYKLASGGGGGGVVVGGGGGSSIGRSREDGEEEGEEEERCWRLTLADSLRSWSSARSFIDQQLGRPAPAAPVASASGAAAAAAK